MFFGVNFINLKLRYSSNQNSIHIKKQQCRLRIKIVPAKITFRFEFE